MADERFIYEPQRRHHLLAFPLRVMRCPGFDPQHTIVACNHHREVHPIAAQAARQLGSAAPRKAQQEDVPVMQTVERSGNEHAHWLLVRWQTLHAMATPKRSLLGANGKNLREIKTSLRSP